MAESLDDVITSSIHDAEDGILPDASPSDASSGDTSGSTDSGDTGGSAPAEAVSPSSGAAAAAPAATAEPAEPDELTKELATFGIHPPVEGQREGRFTWGKVRKVIENTRKKAADQHASAIKEHETKLQQATERLKNMDAVDRMIVEDPDRYLRVLASIHPDKYGKYVAAPNGNGASGPTTPAPAAAPVGEGEPQPNAQFADGTVGYDAEGTSRLMAWHRQQAKNEAVAEMEATIAKRFGPMERQFNSQREKEEFERVHVPIVRSQIAIARQTWGPAIDTKENELAIAKVMAENDGKDGRPYLDFNACIARVLLPKTQADRNAIRADVIKEMNARPAAAARTGAAASNGHAGTETSLDDIIRQAMAGAK